MEGEQLVKKVTMATDPCQKEVKGILKKGNKEGNSGKTTSNQGQTKFNVQDSMEIAKKHLQQIQEDKKKVR